MVECCAVKDATFDQECKDWVARDSEHPEIVVHAETPTKALHDLDLAIALEVISGHIRLAK